MVLWQEKESAEAGFSINSERIEIGRYLTKPSVAPDEFSIRCRSGGRFPNIALS